MGGLNPDPGFWAGKSVLLTGHTGFKGAWAGLWLGMLGARVSGMALDPDTSPNLHDLLAGASRYAQDGRADIRDAAAVRAAVASTAPTIVIHMAAQPLVRRSFAQPVETFETNVMGTVHVIEALRALDGLEAALFVTTDKVYRNTDDGRPFAEGDPLGGHDPYSASKAASELVVASYAHSFFAEIPVATARAGNVIGGGDWSEDRLIPDVIRAAEDGAILELRNPAATRPWQHVLDAVSGYLLYVEALAQSRSGLPRALNFGPPAGECASVAEVAEAMGQALGVEQPWEHRPSEAMPEMNLLSLDPTLASQTLGWKQRLSCDEAIAWTADWHRQHKAGEAAVEICRAQIDAFCSR